MFLRLIKISATMLVFICLSSVTAADAADNPVPVTLNSEIEITQGNYFVATIEIGKVSDLNKVQFDLTFDPNLVNLENTSQGYIGDSSFPTTYTEIEPGRCVFIGYAGSASLSGEGSLVILTFYTVGSGTVEISLSNGTLSTSDDTEIPSTWTGTTVTITSGEPSGTSGTTTSPVTTEGTSGSTTVPDTTGSSADTGNSGDNNANVQIIQETESIVVDEAGNEKDTLTAEPGTETVNVAAGVKWPVLFGIIGGVLVIILIVIYANAKKRGYLG